MRKKLANSEEQLRARRPLLCWGWFTALAARLSPEVGHTRCCGGSGASSSSCCWRGPAAWLTTPAAPQASTTTTTAPVSTFTWAWRRWRSFWVRRPAYKVFSNFLISVCMCMCVCVVMQLCHWALHLWSFALRTALEYYNRLVLCEISLTVIRL